VIAKDDLIRQGPRLVSRHETAIRQELVQEFVVPDFENLRSRLPHHDMSFSLFSPTVFGTHVAPLLNEMTSCELGPGTPNYSHEVTLRGLTADKLGGGRPLQDQASADACLAGLWLLHGFLDASHEISQGLPSAEGSFWHGIMHRRERDYSNAKYWFRQTGRHAVFIPLIGQVHQRAKKEFGVEALPADAELAKFCSAESWDPFRFVDLVERAIRAGSPERPICEKIAWIEWQLLFDHCYRQAFGLNR
jgi:hypothetical protein